MDAFSFAARDRFLDREPDLARMEDWWSGRDANALALYGRRRVGGPQTILFSRSGFSDRLTKAAQQRGDVTLIDVEQLVSDLLMTAA